MPPFLTRLMRCASQLGQCCALVALACVLAPASSVHAQAQRIDYRLDPGFNGGEPFLDRFAGIAAANYRGKFVVRVPDGENAPNPDGDIVVVGEVPGAGQVDNLHGNTNIGLVRYNAQGVRQAFRGGQTYGHYDNQYIVFPGDEITRSSGAKSVVAVTPVHNGFFYVLTNEYYSVEPQVDLLYLRKFSTNGSYQSGIDIIANRFDGPVEHLNAIDMTLVHDGANSAIMILARHRYTGNVITGCDADFGCSVLLRVNLDAEGDPTRDTVFDIKRIGHPYDYVNNDESGLRPTAIASGTRGNLSPFVYIVGTHVNDGVERVKLKKYTASGDYIGQTKLVFRNDPAYAETGARLAVADDNANGYHHVYVAAQTQQRCAPGMGVAKITDAGSLVGTFGEGGMLLVGGNNDALDTQACAFAKAAEPRGMVVSDGRVAIAGQISEDVDWNNVYPTGMLTVIDAATGTLIDFAGHFFRAPDGYPIGHAVFNSVVPGSGGRYYVAGEQRDTNNQNRPMFTTARLVGPDLFADSYE